MDVSATQLVMSTLAMRQADAQLGAQLSLLKRSNETQGEAVLALLQATVASTPSATASPTPASLPANLGQNINVTA